MLCLVLSQISDEVMIVMLKSGFVNFYMLVCLCLCSHT